MSEPRLAEYDVDSLFISRSSPRSFTAEEIPDAVLFSMFEAARWAPSSSNIQPWRFAYARKGTPEWAPLFESLVPFNQMWVAKASVLVAFVSAVQVERNGELVPNGTHGFDTGAAWMSFALQGEMLGWATHGMAGFDPAKGREALGLSEAFALHMFAAVGRRGPVEALPEALREREVASARRSLRESVFLGRIGS
jgi:nitroreductase